MTLNGNAVTPTSTFPYTAIGPIDFSQLNFVKTTQTDYYYGTGSTGNQLLSQVTQTYDPSTAILEIAGLIILFFATLIFFIKIIRKMGK